MSRGTLIVLALFVPILLIQWACISYLLLQNQAHELESAPTHPNHHQQSLETLPTTRKANNHNNNTIRDDTALRKSRPQFKGVAATLMINSPKWFQRRYTNMITNVLLNIPSDWALQIFYYDAGQSQFGLDINPGISRLMRETSPFRDRVIMTKISKEMWQDKGPRRKLLYWTDEWMWSQMVADRVLVFSGNGKFWQGRQHCAL